MKQHPLNKPTVLIVDDEQLSIDLLKLALEAEYRILLATSGAEALKIAACELPDIILLDIMMPGMDGYEVCSILKSTPQLQEIPVIFITCMSETENESHGLELGAADYIVKPYNNGIVRLRVRNHLQLKHQRDQLTCQATELQRSNDDLATEITERKKIQAAHEQLITELENACAKVKTLNGLLPICASCKKIRDDNGYWEQIESYLKKHSELEFSHGLCQECARKLYPGLTSI